MSSKIELLRQKFLAIYSKLPMGAREEIILVLKKEGPDGVIRQSLTWDVACFEIQNKTSKGNEILEKLEKLEII